MEEKRIISVSELNEYVKMLIDNDEILMHVHVRDEISNFTNHRTGHFYMTLKDEGSLILRWRIACAYARRLYRIRRRRNATETSLFQGGYAV